MFGFGYDVTNANGNPKEHAKDENVAFLVVGDPFGATTHTDIVLRAVEKGIKV